MAQPKKPKKGTTPYGPILTEIELAEKARDGTLTVGEAIDFAQANAKRLHPTAKTYEGNMTTLRNHLELLDISPDTPYKDMPDQIYKFTVEGTPEFDSKGKELKPANRITPLQTLESILRKGEQTPFERYGIIGVTDSTTGVKMYPQLVGAGTGAGGQRTSLAQTRQMRGVLPQDTFVQMYTTALPKIVESHGQAVADIMQYHATTFNRPEQLLELKKSDVFIQGDQITVRGKEAVDNKGRPELSYKVDSPMGQLLQRNLNSGTSEFLFDVTETEMDQAFARHITPQLEPYSNILPVIEDKSRNAAGQVIRTERPVLTKSVVRHIVPTYFIDELGVDERLVDVLMGHKKASTLRKHYAGMRTNVDLPKILENPSDFARMGFNQNPNTINLDNLSDEQKENIAKDQLETLTKEAKAAQKTADADIAEATARETKAKAAVTPEEIQKAAEVDEALIRADETRKENEREIRRQVRAEIKASKLDATGDTAAGNPSERTLARMEELGLLDDVPAEEPPEPDPPKRRRRRAAKKAATAAGTTAATMAAKAAKAAGFIVPGPDPFELGAGVLDAQLSPPGESAADIAVERGQKFVGDLLGVEAKRAESMSDLFTKETLAETAGGIGGILADYATLGTVSGTGPFDRSTGSISGRNLRAQQLRERQNAEEGFVKRPGLGIPKP
jgi:hypothetical protein